MTKNLFLASLLWLGFIFSAVIGVDIAIGADAETNRIGTPANVYDSYLSELKRRVESNWKYPDNLTGVQKVAIRFAIDRDGNLVLSEVLDSSDPRLNAAVLEAIRRASPFQAIPEKLKDLANEPIIIRFQVTLRERGSR